MKSFLLDHRRALVIACHTGIFCASIALAFWLRFDFDTPESEWVLFERALWTAALLKTIVFLAAGLDRGWWRFVGIDDLWRVFTANVVASGCFTAAMFAQFGWGFPRSVYIIDLLVCFLMTAGARFAVRLYNEAIRADLSIGGKGLLIYGAGAASVMLLREIRSNATLGYDVVGLIDDDPKLRSATIMNVPVLGGGSDISHIVERYKATPRKIEEIVIAMPSASGRQMREAVANCRAAGIPCKTIPGIGELLNGKYLTSQIRNVSVDDLLGRAQVTLDEERIQQDIAGRTIMVTGAAGSIGSELCRQIATYRPKKLIAFDQAESDLYRLDYELHRKHPALQIIPELGDICDARRLEEVVDRYEVDSIFHAAAYKHVPMMEAHVFEAVKNNIVGTWNLVRIACKSNIRNFLMISSDKAVNPTNIMGVTKRIAELIVSAASTGKENGTKFVSVRFGNVLGSNGSVVPLFQSQIASGGPVTVTHPEVRRYFMSVREAVQLVLQASIMGQESEIFVLDMGEPIRIIDLAKNMIRLAGLIPDEDIEIRVTGLRPGEKLYEELMTSGENVVPTYHEKIKIFRAPPMSPEVLHPCLTQLQALAEKRDLYSVLSHLKMLVPEYLPQGNHSEMLKQGEQAVAYSSHPAFRKALGPASRNLRVHRTAN